MDNSLPSFILSFKKRAQGAPQGELRRQNAWNNPGEAGNGRRMEACAFSTFSRGVRRRMRAPLGIRHAWRPPPPFKNKITRF